VAEGGVDRLEAIDVGIEDRELSGHREGQPAFDEIVERGPVRQPGERIGARRAPGLGFRSAPCLDLVMDVADDVAHLKMVDDDGGEVSELPLPGFIEILARLHVEQADGAYAVAGGSDQRRAGIEAERHVANNERVLGEPLILCRIPDDQNPVIEDRMAAEGYCARRFVERQVAMRLEEMRSESMKATSATGTPNWRRAISATRSNWGSGAVSRMRYLRSASRRASSSIGWGAGRCNIVLV